MLEIFEKEIKELNNFFNKLTEKEKELTIQLNSIKEEKLKLQGQYAAFAKMKNELEATNKAEMPDSPETKNAEKVEKAK